MARAASQDLVAQPTQAPPESLPPPPSSQPDTPQAGERGAVGPRHVAGLESGILPRISRLHASTPMLSYRARTSSRTHLAWSSLVILSVLHSPRRLRTITRKLSRLLRRSGGSRVKRRGDLQVHQKLLRLRMDLDACEVPVCGQRGPLPHRGLQRQHIEGAHPVALAGEAQAAEILRRDEISHFVVRRLVDEDLTRPGRRL
jgi:hypothetical protein